MVDSEASLPGLFQQSPVLFDGAVKPISPLISSRARFPPPLRRTRSEYLTIRPGRSQAPPRARDRSDVGRARRPYFLPQREAPDPPMEDGPVRYSHLHPGAPNPQIRPGNPPPYLTPGRDDSEQRVQLPVAQRLIGIA